MLENWKCITAPRQSFAGLPVYTQLNELEYDVCGGLCVVHIDAHIDWREERDGVREGYSSVMRRASEMP